MGGEEGGELWGVEVGGVEGCVWRAGVNEGSEVYTGKAAGIRRAGKGREGWRDVALSLAHYGPSHWEVK